MIYTNKGLFFSNRQLVITKKLDNLIIYKK